LTGADVAASDDLTGHASLGGDWVFEYTVGDIEAGVIFSPELQANYLSTFANITVDTLDDTQDGGDTSSIAALMATPGSDGISLREAVIAANADTGLDTITLGSGVHNLTLSGVMN